MSSKISIQTTKSSSVLKFFSQNLFLEAVIMPYTGWIETMLPDSKIQDVTQFSEIVLEKFVENEKTKITV